MKKTSKCAWCGAPMEPVTFRVTEKGDADSVSVHQFCGAECSRAWAVDFEANCDHPVITMDPKNPAQKPLVWPPTKDVE